MVTSPESSSSNVGAISRHRRSVVRSNRGSVPTMPPLPHPPINRQILSDSTNVSRTPLPEKSYSNRASTSGTKPLPAGCTAMEPNPSILNNLVVYGHVDQQLEDTITTLRRQNIGIVIRDEAEMNRMFQESKKRKQEAMANFKGKGKQNGKENMRPSASVGEKGKFVSRSMIGQYARRQNEATNLASRTPETCLQPRFFAGSEPRHARLDSFERVSKRVRFSPIVSSSLPTNLHHFNEITPNTSRLHHLAVNLFETTFGLDCQTNSHEPQSLPQQPVLDYIPAPFIEPGVIPEIGSLVLTPVIVPEDPHVLSEPAEPSPNELSCRHDLGLMNVECPYCSALHWMEEKLQKSSNYRPLFGKCCLQGKIRLPDLITPPSAIQSLYDGNDAQSNSFRRYIRQYNAANAFTSLGVQMDDRLRAGSGPTSFTIHGELRHRTGSLIPETGQEPVNPQLRRDVLGIIQDCMKTHNHFYHKYREAAAVLQQLDQRKQQLPIYLHYMSATDHRRYNLPTTDQIAVLLPGDGTEVSGVRDIIIHLKGNNQLTRINECHPAYLPLHYVLFFPRGELGWEPELEQWNVLTGTHNGLRLTQLQFFCFRLFQRSREYSTILRGGKLFQEFIVDAWAATEQNRLSYFRFNQGKLRAEVYRGLTDIVADGVALRDVGRRFILPSSFVGGPRHMFEIFQDSMAITRFNQHPDIFLTMTANPKWPEITSALLPNQNATDRPDLVARIFELKRKALMKDIDNEGVFGQKVAHVYTIEFQKRGLPHMHLLIFLKGQDKIKTCAQVNRCVSAEFPDVQQDPALYDAVRKCMIHGPCGTRNPSAPCMENGKCTKGYPKIFVEETSMGEDGYPIYRRRDDGRCHVNNKGQPIDNRDVVPYNPYLSKKFNCHINVEVCAGLRAVKYIHKYIYKGHDRATMVIGEPDEIKQYLDARYVGPPEAAWRIFGHSMHEEIPNVVRLSLHLEGMHNVVFNPDEPMEAIVARGAVEMTTLPAFFKCCEENESARQLTYQEMPQSWVWRKGEKIWTPRHQGRAIGRMYFASPNEGERFYLRLLLTVVKGPRSYRDLRTVNNVEYPSFKEACIAKGLLEDDDEWKQCLSKAVIMNTGYQLRRLFCVILTHCSPQQPKVLWDLFCIHICDDLSYKLRTVHGVHSPTVSQIEDYGLFLLNLLLQEFGKSLKDFPPMPLPIGDWSTTSENRLIFEHRQLESESLQKDVDVDIGRLNVEQKGLEKPFYIASQLLIGGRTAHSTFCIPLDIQENSICGFNKQSIHAELFRQTKLIIWDEVPMQHKYCVEAVDRTLQDICSNQKPFGGITVVLGGDFRQVLPVVPKGAREQIVSVSLRRSHLWKNLNILSLSLNMRLDANEPGQTSWADFLIQIGSTQQEIAQVPPTIGRCNCLSELIATVYPRLGEPNIATPEFLNERTILAARNDDVSAINDEALIVFPGETTTYLAADKMSEDVDLDRNMENRYPNEFLNSLNPPGLPPFRIDLKVGCPIMLLRNIAPKDGLCNGTRLVVVKCAEFVIEAQILTGDKRGDRVFIPRISLTPSSSELVIKMSRRQFPIRLAYAMTINKSQGQSVKFVGLDLRTPVFSHGQLYVALSRCTSSDRIFILLPPDNVDSTTNIVYPENWDDAVAAYNKIHSTNRRGWRMNNRIYVTTGVRWPAYVDIDTPTFCKLMFRMFKDSARGR